MANWQIVRARLHRPHHGAGDHQHLREVSQQGERTLIVAAVRSPRQRAFNRVAIAAVLVITFIFLSPLYWIGSTAFKPRNLATTVPPTVPLRAGNHLFHQALRQAGPTHQASRSGNVRQSTMVRAAHLRWRRTAARVGPRVQLSQYPNRFLDSLIVAVASTAIAVSLGTITAYGFSRFRIAGESDLLFFHPVYPNVAARRRCDSPCLMYRAVGLNDTHIGLIVLYTAFNLSFSVWLMKGFMDEIPKEYEEAALVNSYTRLQAFFKIVLPEAVTGIAATAVFCFITAWNEYAFALMMTNRRAQTAPPFIPSQIGSGLTDWTVIAAGDVPLPAAGGDFHLRAAQASAARRYLRRDKGSGSENDLPGDQRQIFGARIHLDSWCSASLHCASRGT